jgi:hypothetical protein
MEYDVLVIEESERGDKAAVQVLFGDGSVDDWDVENFTAVSPAEQRKRKSAALQSSLAAVDG